MSTNTSDVIYLPEVASKLGMTEAALRGHIQRRTDGIPPFFWIGRRLAWRRSTVDEWLVELERQSQNQRVVRPTRRRLGGSTSLAR